MCTCMCGCEYVCVPHAITLYAAVCKRKKCSERRKHCVLAVARRSQKFCPAADLFLGAWDGQNLTSWRWSLPSPTDPAMHAISSYHGNIPTHPRHTHTHTHPPNHKQTDRTDYNTLLDCNVMTYGTYLTVQWIMQSN